MEDSGKRHSLPLNELWWYTKALWVPNQSGCWCWSTGPRTSYHESMGIFPSPFQAEVHAIEQYDEINIDKNYRSVLACNVVI